MSAGDTNVSRFGDMNVSRQLRTIRTRRRLPLSLPLLPLHVAICRRCPSHLPPPLPFKFESLTDGRRAREEWLKYERAEDRQRRSEQQQQQQQQQEEQEEQQSQGSAAIIAARHRRGAEVLMSRGRAIEQCKSIRRTADCGRSGTDPAAPSVAKRDAAVLRHVRGTGGQSQLCGEAWSSTTRKQGAETMAGNSSPSLWLFVGAMKSQDQIE